MSQSHNVTWDKGAVLVLARISQCYTAHSTNQLLTMLMRKPMTFAEHCHMRQQYNPCAFEDVSQFQWLHNRSSFGCWQALSPETTRQPLCLYPCFIVRLIRMPNTIVVLHYIILAPLEREQGSPCCALCACRRDALHLCHIFTPWPYHHSNEGCFTSLLVL